MSVKDYEKRIEKNVKECPAGSVGHMVHGAYAIAYGLLAIAKSIEDLTEVMKEK